MHTHKRQAVVLTFHVIKVSSIVRPAAAASVLFISRSFVRLW